MTGGGWGGGCNGRLQIWWRRRRKASRFSVDIGQVLVVPVEVSTSVDPILGTCVWIGAHLEPPKRSTQVTLL